ncbi:MAG: M48 family metalloprotease [Firmicutes bacterium]|nr:M48 family metalloprotease [Bacillota bacterium]
MRTRRRWITTLVLLVVLVAGCSQTPKVTRIAGTIIDTEGKPISKAGLLIGSSMTKTNSAGQFSISALSGESQAILLAKGSCPQILSLNLGQDAQTVTLTANPGKPTKRSGSTVDYILLFDSLRSTDITGDSRFTYLTGNDVRKASLTHAGIINLNEAVEYLSPEALHSLCQILKTRHLVWINQDLKDHLQVFAADSRQISNLPFKQRRGVKQINALLANSLRGRDSSRGQYPEGAEARLAREVKSYMERMYDVTYSGPDLERIKRVAKPVIEVSERPNLLFTFGILEAPEYNAYALPGGYIFITRPLLEMMESDAELAAVLAHESAHITHVHAVKSYERQVALTVAGVFLTVATGDIESSFDFVQAIGDIMTVGYSKEQEYDADATGLRYISRASYDPTAMLSLLTKLQDLEYRLTGRRRGYSRTHPATENRIKQVKAQLSTNEYYRCLDEYLQTL